MWICAASKPGVPPVPVDVLPAAECTVLVERYSSSSWSADQQRPFGLVLARLRERHFWLMCDCRGDDPAVAPVMFPRRMENAIRLVRNVDRPAHAESCPFQFEPPERCEHRKHDSPIAVPVSALADPLILHTAADKAAPSATTGRSAAAASAKPIPVIAHLLWTVIERAGLNVVSSQAPRPTLRSEIAKIEIALNGMLIDGVRRSDGGPLSMRDLSVTFAGELVKPERGVSGLYRAFAAHRAVLEKAGRRPQAFFFGFIRDVHGAAIDHAKLPEGFVLDVPVSLRSERRDSAGPPYLLAIAYGQQPGSSRFAAIQAFAQPVYEVSRSFAQLVPVNSRAERDCLHILKSLQFVMLKSGGVMDVTIRRPVLSIATPRGPCLPDFLLDVVNGDGEVRRFVVDLAGNEMEENAERIARQSTLGIVFRLRPEEVATDAYRATRDELIGRINDALRTA